VSREGKTLYQHDIQYRSQGKHWIPSSWRYNNFETHTKQQSVRVSHELTVDAVETGTSPTDEEFTPSMRPGTLVRDASSYEQLVVNSEGELRPRDRAAESRRWKTSRWILLGVLIAAIVTASVLIIRKRSRIIATTASPERGGLS
jgi:hypothetical protein